VTPLPRTGGAPTRAEISVDKDAGRCQTAGEEPAIRAKEANLRHGDTDGSPYRMSDDEDVGAFASEPAQDARACE
jgi:hypothetical protein